VTPTLLDLIEEAFDQLARSIELRVRANQAAGLWSSACASIKGV
jgi:hypothetical protein